MYRKTARMFASLCVSLCLLGAMPVRVAAWSKDGHKIVALIALWRLEQLKAKNALRNINDILNSTPETPMPRKPSELIEAATWPDDVREEDAYKFAANLHFVSILVDKNVDKDRYNKFKNCKPSTENVPQIPEGVCIIGALEHYSKVLATSTSKKERLEALSFITHFMGDMHQPLHTSEDMSFINHLKPDAKNPKKDRGDRGGNHRFIFYLDEKPFRDIDPESCLKKPNACTEGFKNEDGEDIRSNRKLHAAWDKYMIVSEMRRKNSERPDFEAYAKFLTASLPKNPLATDYASMEKGDFVSWAEATHDLAEKNAYNLAGPVIKISPADGEEYKFYLLDNAYREKNLKIIDRQLILAGIRLAALLRQIYPDA